jgi:hypothetical protein
VTVMTERHIVRIHFHLPDTSDADVYERLVEQLHGINPRTQALPPADADCDVTGARRYYGRTPYELPQLIQLRLKLANEILKAASAFFASMSGCWRSAGGHGPKPPLVVGP